MNTSKLSKLASLFFITILLFSGCLGIVRVKGVTIEGG